MVKVWILRTFITSIEVSTFTISPFYSLLKRKERKAKQHDTLLKTIMKRKKELNVYYHDIKINPMN